MASPVVESTAESATTTSGTSHTINLPSGVASGDLVVVFFGHSQACTANALTGWTELEDEPSLADSEKWLYRLCDGTEGATITLVTSASTRSATLAWRISGAENPATQAPQLSTVATGTSATPDPAIVTPTGGSKDYLWIAAFVQAGEEADDDTWCNNAPTSFTNLIQKTCGTAGAVTLNCSVAGANFASTASSMNPATFGTDQSLAYRAWTLAVHPVGASSATATPAVIAATTTAPAATIRATAVTAPTSIAAVTSFGAHTVIAGGSTVPVDEAGRRIFYRVSETGTDLLHTDVGLTETGARWNGTLNEVVPATTILATTSFPMPSVATTAFGAVPTDETGRRANESLTETAERIFIVGELAIAETGRRVFGIVVTAAIPGSIQATTSMATPTIQAAAEAEVGEIGASVDMPTPQIQIVPAPQTARPDADFARDTWTTDSGGTTNLWDSINEVAASDADYVKSSTSPTDDELVLTLANVEDPVSSTGHVVRFRYRRQ